MPGIFRLAPLALAGAVAACGGGASSPTQPTTPRIPNVLTITPATAAMFVGETRLLSAFMVYCDGAGATVPATWRADSPAATIDDRGLLSAVSPGLISVSAVAEGRSATISVRILPDFNGEWTARLIPIACTAAHMSSCAYYLDPAYVNGSVSVSVSLTHVFDRVTGTLATSLGVGPVSGTITVDGGLSLQGASEGHDSYHDVTYVAFRIGSWSSTVDRGRLTGRAVLQRAESPEYLTSPNDPTLAVTVEFRDLARR